MVIYEGETQSQSIESDTPFLTVNVGDEITHAHTRVHYGKVARIRHWVAPLGGIDGSEVRHEIHIHCRK